MRGGLKEGYVKMSPYGPPVSDAAKKKADAIKAAMLKGSFVIFKGPLKDNKGNTVIAAGTDPTRPTPSSRRWTTWSKASSAPFPAERRRRAA